MKSNEVITKKKQEMVRLTFLGTGTSQGVPMIGCSCPVCRSCDPHDKRLRSSAFVEYGGLDILVDAGPDFRQQMLRADIRHIDAILLTHNHKDHTGGLDDVRAFNYIERAPIRIYCEKYVEESIIYDRGYKIIIIIMRDVTEEENERYKKENMSRQTIEITDKVIEKQMRVVQEIASLLGETTAETKIALTNLKESLKNE